MKKNNEKRDNMKLYVPIPSCFKFKRMFDENEYLQKVLEEDRNSISLWYIEDNCDMSELRRILVGNKINYKITE